MRISLLIAPLAILAWTVAPSAAEPTPRAGNDWEREHFTSQADAPHATTVAARSVSTDKRGDVPEREARKEAASATRGKPARGDESPEGTSHPRGRARTLGEGLSYMVLGMSMTFLFLLTLVICMHGLHLFLVFFNRFLPEAAASSSSSAPTESTDDHVALAIAVARAQRKG